MPNQNAVAESAVDKEVGVENNLKAVVSSAMLELGGDGPSILRRSFGIGGEEPLTEKELAAARGESETKTKEEREDSLRALMGYGPRAKMRRIIV